jgi:hypothetical protein
MKYKLTTLSPLFDNHAYVNFFIRRALPDYQNKVGMMPLIIGAPKIGKATYG